MKHRRSIFRPAPPSTWRTEGRRRTPGRVARASSVASLLARVVTR